MDAREEPRPAAAGGLATHFATPLRSSDDDLLAEIHFASHNAVVETLLTHVAGMLAVLNDRRQILAVNLGMAEGLGIEDPAEVLGLRPGEALGCEHAADMPAGCGTGLHCRSCGAAVAIVGCLGGDKQVHRTCTLTVRRDGAEVPLFLDVLASPLVIESRRFVFLFLRDDTEHQRRAVLDRTFFHDVRNLVHGLGGLAEMMQEETGGSLRELAGQMLSLTRRLTREVEFQKLLVNGVSTLAEAAVERVTAQELLTEARDNCRHHPAAADRRLVLVPAPDGLLLQTDPVLVLRILRNMAVNALEATPPGGEVRLAAVADVGGVEFTVWNAGVLPAEVAARIFQLNFSTKEGSGRGLGTHMMRRFAREALGGEVDFSSDPVGGTTFRLRLPR